ncbi:hypothetical protein ACFL2V_16535 [Pseudomonadota bacterium]
MEISGISSPTVSQVSREKTGEAVGATTSGQAADVDVDAEAQVVNSVTSPSQEVPSEKLPPHLGRNVNVTA